MLTMLQSKAAMQWRDFESIFNLVMSGVPLLAKIVFFVILLLLLVEAIQKRGKLAFMEKAALLIALGLAVK